MNEFAERAHEIHEPSESKRLLRELEQSGQYVFHGSPKGDITELEIRQPLNWKDGVPQEDGLPSISATPFADIAIFRALIYQDRTGFGSDNGKLHFEASQKALDDAHGKTGCVYVLWKKNFKPKNGDIKEMDWRSLASQKPLQTIFVTEQDLPSGIKKIQSKT